MSIRRVIASRAASLALLALVGSAGFPVADAGAADAPAAFSRFALDLWRESDGLPQSRIRHVVQTRDGYLWLGTAGGIVRFDGAKFTTFNTQTGSLNDNEVWALREDKDGGLWI